MKKLLTILLIFGTFCPIVAQIPAHFAPIGTRWEYNYYSFGQEYGRFIYESERDTLINGTTHRIIKRIRTVKCDYPSCIDYVTTISSDWLTVRNDSLLAVTTSGYRFLFNFNYRVGDSVSVAYLNVRNQKPIIWRISDTLINGKRLKFWETKQTCSNVGTPKVRYGKIYELIGTIGDGFYEFQDFCLSDPNLKSICSVKSGDWVYNPAVCQYSVGTKDVAASINATLFPNPTTHELTIDYTARDAADLTVKIYDVLGKMVHGQKIDTATATIKINVAHFEAGIYELTLQSANQQPFAQRFVKQ
jgi:Secretion system C-terminal sorting domain